jgi:hypothetical protein
MSKLTDFFPSGGGQQNALLVMVGGGGGAGIGATFSCGAAGGDILCTFLSLKTGISCPIVVGAGGAAGCTNPTCCGQPGGTGGDGGFSSFGNLRAPGGGGSGSTCSCSSIIPSPPYMSPLPVCCFPAIAKGGIGGSYITGHYTRILRGLPLSYPGFVGSTARRSNTQCFSESFNPSGPVCCPECNPGTYWCCLTLEEHSTILYKNRVVKNCVSATVPIATCIPGCPGTFCQMCRVICSNFYNVELSGQPYSGSNIVGESGNTAWPLLNRIEFNITQSTLGCTRFSGASRCYIAIPNNPNTGHSGKIQGCNGDSGVVVVFYPVAMPAASSFPGGIDCTPVSCPSGMRAYKFTTSGSITI